jgi:hypothetical protein
MTVLPPQEGTVPTSRPYPKRSGPTSLLNWSAVTIGTGLANQQRMPPRRDVRREVTRFSHRERARKTHRQSDI